MKDCIAHVLVTRTVYKSTSPKLVILMELAVCDLHGFFKYHNYNLSVREMFRVWLACVRTVETAHKEDMLHRDLKPQNFLLVPSTPAADFTLGASVNPKTKLQFRLPEWQEQSSAGGSSHDLLDEGGPHAGGLNEPPLDVQLILRSEVGRLLDGGTAASSPRPRTGTDGATSADGEGAPATSPQESATSAAAQEPSPRPRTGADGATSRERTGADGGAPATSPQESATSAAAQEPSPPATSSAAPNLVTAATILSTTTTVGEDGSEQVVLPLSIKLTDFGLARPLQIDVSHLSVEGYSGTVM